MKHCANPECPDRLPNGTVGEFRDEIDACPYCGQRLEWGPAPPPTRDDGGAALDGTEEIDGEMAEVGHFLSPIEADLARGFLESQGIPARIARDAAGGARPDLSGLTGIRLLVPASLAEDAQELLASVESEEDPDLSP